MKKQVSCPLCHSTEIKEMDHDHYGDEFAISFLCVCGTYFRVHDLKWDKNKKQYYRESNI